MNSKSFHLTALAKALVVLLYAGAGSLAIAQTAPDAGARQRELDLQILREPRPPLVQPAKPEQAPLDKQGQQIQLSRFTLEGNTLFSASELGAVVNSWAGKSVYVSELQDAALAIQNFYLSKGRIAQATLPPQEIKEGVVLIKILEGKMGSVIVEPANKTAESTLRFSAERAKAYITRGVEGEVFINTQPIERAMLLLNEASGVYATGAFETANDVGFSNFKVKITDTPWISGQAALSNHGSASTGKNQAIANVSINNISGMGDQVYLNAIRSEGSGYVVANYMIPIGVEGWKAGIQTSYLHYLTLPSWSLSQTEGSAKSFQANTSYALQRSQGANSTAKLSVEKRSYENNQTNPVASLSSYQLRAANASINGDMAMSDGSVVNYSAGFVYGNLGIRDLAQAQQDQNSVRTAGAYSKLSFSLSYAQDISLLPNTMWTNSVYGQVANKNLNSSEQIYLGGANGVRAYPTSQGGGSQGAIFTSEINHRLNETWHIGAFADVGMVQQYVNTFTNWEGLTRAKNNYQLRDAGLTAKYFYGKASVSASVARRVGDNPLFNSSGEQLNVDKAYKAVQAWVRASVPF